MCGIVGYVGSEPALPILLEGLNGLAYRGYDSSGVAYVEEGIIRTCKRKGRLDQLHSALIENGLLTAGSRSGQHVQVMGIGHTRWATHGAPSNENAHPHVSGNGHIAVVHNGIIENDSDLRGFLKSKGYHFSSETDTEVLAHLIEYHYLTNRTAGLISAVRQSLAEVTGSYALGIICADLPDCFIAARKDSPLVIGLANDGHYVASDIPAILSRTRQILIMEDREIAVLDRYNVMLYDSLGQEIQREPFFIPWDCQVTEKGGFQHFMLKEIHESPQAVRATLKPYIWQKRIRLTALSWQPGWVTKLRSIRIVACGTAYHAGMFGKVVIEKLCRIPVHVEIASEFRYSEPILDDTTLVLIISQSGETLDTLAAMREVKRQGSPVLAIVNVAGSSIAREADSVIYTAAGPEIAVASTKAYNTQLAALYLVALYLAEMGGQVTGTYMAEQLAALQDIPASISTALLSQDAIQRFAAGHYNAKSIFFIGRGLDYALAMEASLKLKEVSYIHSEAYAGGELKHGTIALIENGTLVISPLTQPGLLDKMISNIREVKARGAIVLGLLTPACAKAAEYCDAVIWLPDVSPLLAPLVAVTPTQLFAYYMSVLKGLDVDKPRNLAKSVTVE